MLVMAMLVVAGDVCDDVGAGDVGDVGDVGDGGVGGGVGGWLLVLVMLVVGCW